MADYHMRAYHTVLTEYVLWFSLGQPDFAGSSSGYNPGDLTAISVALTVETGGVVPGDAGGPWDYPRMAISPLAPVDTPVFDVDRGFTAALTDDGYSTEPLDPPVVAIRDTDRGEVSSFLAAGMATEPLDPPATTTTSAYDRGESDALSAGI